MSWVDKLQTARELDQTVSATEGFREAVMRLAVLDEGRNNELNKVAFIGGTLVSAGKAEQWWVEQELRDACEQNNLIKDDGETAFQKTLESGLKNGLAVEPEHDNPLHKMAVPVGRLGSLPPAKWLVKDLFQENSLVFLVAEPGVGKSFMALDLAAHLSDKPDWHGKPIHKNVETIYITPEGTGSLNNRRLAWEKVNRCSMSGITFFPFSLQIGSPSWDFFIDYADEKQPGLVVIDTLSRNASGREENSNSDMAAVVAEFDRLREVCGCTVLVVHHLNKGVGGPRGASSLIGAADTVIKIADRGDGIINGFMLKQKDGPENHLGQFRLKHVDLNNDVSSVAFTPVPNIPWADDIGNA